ncbi:hypothetical protein P7C73_g2169, partial [Tremellales sp. Uapishka_1]
MARYPFQDAGHAEEGKSQSFRLSSPPGLRITAPEFRPSSSSHSHHTVADPSSQRYQDARSTLGLTHDGSISPRLDRKYRPYHEPPLHHFPARPSKTPPPISRAWTLDSPSTRSILPLHRSHLLRPLTRSPLTSDHDGYQRSMSPGANIDYSLSLPPGSPRDGQRSVTLSPRSLRSDSGIPERPTRGFSGRVGGPPKAVLGGPGGKTFEETQRERKATTPVKGNEDLGGSTTPSKGDNEGKWNGNAVLVKLPPERYSPPDSPRVELMLPEEWRNARRNAFPWPTRTSRYSPAGIPLPLTPSTSERASSPEKGRRHSILSPVEAEGKGSGSWKGRTVTVSVPDQAAWTMLLREFARSRAEHDAREMGESEGEAESDVDEATIERARHIITPRKELLSIEARTIPLPDTGSTSDYVGSQSGSPTKRHFSSGNSAFLRRQLGGLVRDPLERGNHVQERKANVEIKKEKVGLSPKSTLGLSIRGSARTNKDDGDAMAVKVDDVFDSPAQNVKADDSFTTADTTMSSDDVIISVKKPTYEEVFGEPPTVASPSTTGGPRYNSFLQRQLGGFLKTKETRVAQPRAPLQGGDQPWDEIPVVFPVGVADSSKAAAQVLRGKTGDLNKTEQDIFSVARGTSVPLRDSQMNASLEAKAKIEHSSAAPSAALPRPMLNVPADPFIPPHRGASWGSSTSSASANTLKLRPTAPVFVPPSLPRPPSRESDTSLALMIPRPSPFDLGEIEQLIDDPPGPTSGYSGVPDMPISRVTSHASSVLRRHVSGEPIGADLIFPRSESDASLFLDPSIPPPRARSDTVAFGQVPHSPSVDGASSAGIDLGGLFYRPPTDSLDESLVDGDILAWRDATPPQNDNLEEVSWRPADEEPSMDQHEEQIRPRRQLTLKSGERERPTSISASSEGIVIHPSHPFHSRHTTTTMLDHSPDVPRSAHTQLLSESFGISSPVDSRSPEYQEVADRDSRVGLRERPLPPPSAGLDPTAKPFVFRDPDAFDFAPAASHLGGKAVKPLSATPTFKAVESSNGDTSGPYTTADGSPLIPQRDVRAMRLLPDIPTMTPTAEVYSRRSSDLGNSTLQPAFTAEPPSQPEIRLFPLDPTLRFRQWIFPLQNPERLGGDAHGQRPSVSRRHTMPAESPLFEYDFPGSRGIASTSVGPPSPLTPTIHRKSSSAGLVSRRQSVEFPLRSTPPKRLTIVNATPAQEVESPKLLTHARATEGPDDLWEEIRLTLKGQNALLLEQAEKMERERTRGEQSLRSEMEETRKAVASVLHSIQQPVHSSSDPVILRIAAVLEDHSEILQQLREPAHRAQTPSDDGVQNENLLAALLTGQHAIMDKFSEVTDSKEELQTLLVALRETQEEVSNKSSNAEQDQRTLGRLESQLEESRIRFSEARAEAEVLSQRLRDVRGECDLTKQELEAQNIRIDELKTIKTQSDAHIEAKLVAESERDAMAEEVRWMRVEKERQQREMESLREELQLERERSGAFAINNDIAQTQVAQLTELSQATVTFQSELLERLSKLDGGMETVNNKRVKDLEVALDRQRILQGEMDSLRERLEAAADRFANLQLTTTTSLSTSENEKRLLRDKVEEEQVLRQESQRKVSEVEETIDQIREEKAQYLAIASQRETWSRMAESRMQEMAQENLYLRQTVQELHRHLFKGFMNTKPFKPRGEEEMRPMDSVISTELQTPPEGNILGRTGSPTTPTKASERRNDKGRRRLWG